MIQSYSLQFNITTRLERNKTGSLLNTVNVIYLKLFLLFNYTQLIYPISYEFDLIYFYEMILYFWKWLLLSSFCESKSDIYFQTFEKLRLA